MNSTVRRLLLGTAYTIGGIGLALAADSAAHATDKPPAVEVESPGGAVDLPADVVDVVLPEDPPPPCDEPAAEEPTPKPREDEPEPPKDDKPEKPADEAPAEPEPAPSDEPAEPTPAPAEPTPPADPIVELPPVDLPPIVIDPPVTEPVVVDVPPVAVDVPPVAVEVPPVVAPAEPAPATPPPVVQLPALDDVVDVPLIPAPTTPAKPAPAPPAEPTPAPAVPLPVTIGPVAATGITLDGTTTVAIDDIPATTGVPLCGDTPTEPTRDYPRGHVRRILDAATGQPVTVPADPPAKPCPSKPAGPDATPAPTMKPPTTNGVDLLTFTRDKALHHPTPPLLHHIWPRAWIPATRAEHIEPRPA